MAQLLVGGYTADMDGSASGIGMLLAGDPDSASAFGPLGFAGTVVDSESPSWITRHPSLDVVYAALEGQGAVRAYRQVDERRFVAFGAPVEAGELACHVAVAPDVGSLLVSCWGDGRVVRVGLGADGFLGERSELPGVDDPWADEPVFGAQPTTLFGVSTEEVELASAPDRASRAHQARFLPDGWLATTDMGFDVVRLWRADAGAPRLRDAITLPRGSGPRHMVWHPSGHLYVVTELSHEVFVLALGADGHWGIVGSAHLGAGILVDDTAAEIALSRDGEFVYAGVRGSNTIAVLRVRGEGSALDAVALVEAGVDWPRHHVLVRDTLLVAGQLSDEVASLTVDARSGIPGRALHRTAVPSPTCLVV
ncbi:3-carboxymuconate cyclase [Microbacterium mangrovi]|uniref:3-carboxymuconate cyclase n=1 Tax=Microbacterium mangrovi TaxID=1348253 RepID=A0A0B1ZZ57_9MICO|nr:beta-propeller fold lactonase family protein [Microbacterium mangrovi]KHK96026.1 3-carboxymuconate cyclase [Microbacterium mangrovi]